MTHRPPHGRTGKGQQRRNHEAAKKDVGKPVSPTNQTEQTLRLAHIEHAARERPNDQVRKVNDGLEPEWEEEDEPPGKLGLETQPKQQTGGYQEAKIDESEGPECHSFRELQVNKG